MRLRQWLLYGILVTVIGVGLVVASLFLWAAMTQPATLAAMVEAFNGTRTAEVSAPTPRPDSPLNQPPNVPADPSLDDNAMIQPDNVVLRWRGGDPDGDDVLYRIYLEADDTTPDVLIAEQRATSYTTDTLRAGTSYYWQIEAVDPQDATTRGPIWRFTTTAEEENFATQVVALTNQERIAAGCPPLTVDARLNEAAIAHSEDMAQNDFLSHTGSNSSTPWERIRATGYDYMLAAENVAGGFPTPEGVVKAWMESEDHRQNIVNCEFTEIGVGYYADPQQEGAPVTYTHYWTQLFATPR